MQNKITQIVMMSFLIMGIVSCGGGGGSNIVDDPNLNVNGAVGSVTLSAIEDETTTLMVPYSYLIPSTVEDVEEEFWDLKVHVVNKTQNTIYFDYAEAYYFEDESLFYKIKQRLEMPVSPVSDGDEIAIVLVHNDQSWERYAITVDNDESVAVSPNSGDAYAQNEAGDYTSAEELWCLLSCDACDHDEEIHPDSRDYTSGRSSFFDGECPE